MLVTTIWCYRNRPIEESPLIRSCQRLKLKHYITQRGRTWVNFRKNKFDMFYEDIKNNILDSEIILYCDGDDSVVFKDFDPLAIFEHYNTDFVMGAEVLCWPLTDKHSNKFPIVARCNYPNAGVWLATKEAIVREFEAMKKLVEHDEINNLVYHPSGMSVSNDDQVIFMEHMTRNNSKIALDYNEKLVLNLNHLNLTDELAFTGYTPIIHGSGSAKGQLKRCLKQLQL